MEVNRACRRTAGNFAQSCGQRERHSSFTSFRLSAIAGKQVDKINVDDPMESQEVLQCISALTKMSNDAASSRYRCSTSTKQAEKDNER